MKTEVGVVRGGTLEDVKSKKFNIYLGISLNNKWFTKKHIKSYILWGLENTRNRFGVVIADTLQAINYQVRSKYSKGAALKKSLKEGDRFFDIVEEILNELPKEKRELIDIIRWDDVKKDEFYQLAYPIFLDKFENDEIFKEEIKKIVRDFTNRLNLRKITEERIEKLCIYIIEEFPEIISGFNYKDVKYNCFIYPFDALLLKLVEEIRDKEKFSELHDKLNIRNNVFVELKVLED